LRPKKVVRGCQGRRNGPGNASVGDIRHCFADISLAREVLRYTPRVEFETGLAELVEWLLEQSAEDRVESAAQELSRRGPCWFSRERRRKKAALMRLALVTPQWSLSRKDADAVAAGSRAPFELVLLVATQEMKLACAFANGFFNRVPGHDQAGTLIREGHVVALQIGIGATAM